MKSRYQVDINELYSAGLAGLKRFDHELRRDPIDVLACIFGAALPGLLVRPILPERHQSADSKDTVRLGIGMIATMAGLVLGLTAISPPPRLNRRPPFPASPLRERP